MGAKKAAFALALLEVRPCFAPHVSCWTLKTARQIGYHVGMLDTDAIILRDLREFYDGAMANVSDVMVSSDCVAPFADGKLARPARVLGPVPGPLTPCMCSRL